MTQYTIKGNEMKKNFIHAIKTVQTFSHRNTLVFDDNTYDNIEDKPTMWFADDALISTVIINDDDSIYIAWEINGVIFNDTFDCVDIDEEFLNYLYEECYNYNIGEGAFGMTADEFMDTLITFKA